MFAENSLRKMIVRGAKPFLQTMDTAPKTWYNHLDILYAAMA